MQRLFYTCTLFFLLFAIGCGGNVIITGTVTMADDTAIERGVVFFDCESASAQYSADIIKGTFSPGIMRDGTGIPPGVYRISVGGINREIPSPNPGEHTWTVSRIHSRYASPATSGLTIDTSQTRTIDLVLEPAEE